MTDTAQAEWRWALADERAQHVLAAPPTRGFSVVGVATATAVGLVLLVVVWWSFPSSSTGRFVTVVAGAVLGLAVTIIDAVRTRRGFTRHPERARVVQPLSGRERHAVQRVIGRRQSAPDDRLDVVRAAALQTASGGSLPEAVGPAFMYTAAALASASFWPLYSALAIVAVVALAQAFNAVVIARRYLDEEPARTRSRPLPDRNPGTRSGRSADS